MTRALILFKPGLHYRKELFAAGLKTLGYTAVPSLGDPKPGDLLVIWNRTGESHSKAKQFEAAKASVLVVENGYLGKDWRGQQWFAMAHNHHNGAGSWHHGGPERWDGFGVELAPWRKPGGECVILAQRGIGEQHLRAPEGWLDLARTTTKGRIRRHPGTNKAVPLEADIGRASCVATWASGAAIKALMLGVPVFYGMPKWIGGSAARELSAFKKGPVCDDAARVAMFRRLAWAMWDAGEIESGVAFKTLLRENQT